MDVKSDTTIYPGVYCGGLKIHGGGVVTAKPGVYVIKDGEFVVTGSATLRGENVGFFLTGTAAKTSFDGTSTVELTAPKTGTMAGILFFEDRNSKSGRQFEISSKDARTLVRTIYLPKGVLAVKGKSNFAEISDRTAIIAQEVSFEKGPTISLNSDYKGSDIPVPEGIAAETSKVYLTK